MSYFPVDFNHETLSVKNVQAEKDLSVRLTEFQEDVRKAFKGELTVNPKLLFPEETPRATRDRIALELHEKFPNRIEFLYLSFWGGMWTEFNPEQVTKSGCSYIIMFGLGVNVWKK